MRISGIDFPASLVNAIRDGELVVFAGAGVSMGAPACLPSFERLAAAIARGTSEERMPDETQDQFLGRLKNDGVNIHTIAAENIRAHGTIPTDLHCDLLRLFPRSIRPRIVTTNFDLLFQHAADDLTISSTDTYRAPALPLGRTFGGIVHLHGNVDEPNEMVLTDGDFGRAYLTDGWARRFLVELFRHFTVMFIGYSHSDTDMRYLARALSPADVRDRFALAPESEVSWWSGLGIQPIGYRNGDGTHSALRHGMSGLAQHVGRGVLEWRNQIRAIATKEPSLLDDEERDLINDALSDIARTRFFTDVATNAAWIEWLDSGGHFDGLFRRIDSSSRHGDLVHRDEELAEWLAKSFVLEYSGELIKLIGRHGLRLSPTLWYCLGRSIGLQVDPPLSGRTLDRWVAVLIDSIPQEMHKGNCVTVFDWLGERCSERGSIHSLVSIFRAMSSFNLSIGDDSESVRLTFVADHFHLNEFWERWLRPQLDSVGELILPFAVEQLQSQHQVHLAFGRSDRVSDVGSLRRSAIEPHEQDRHPESGDVIIDAARDCLEHLVSSDSMMAAHWCDMLAGSEAPLLRRLAVHTLPLRRDLSSNARINWLLAKVDLHDLSIHHEAFRALRIIYPKACNTTKQSVVDAILAFESAGSVDEQSELADAGHRYNWIEWLHRADSDCVIVKSALETLMDEHPEFTPREHPDSLFWTTSGPADFQSPLKAQELLAKPPSEWLPYLLAYHGEGFFGPNRTGLLLKVREAATKEFSWGVQLAEQLESEGRWESDIWPKLLQSWSPKLDHDKQGQVLRLLFNADLLAIHYRLVAEHLLSLLKDGGLQWDSDLLPQANGVASALRPYLRCEPTAFEKDDWFFKAINHSAGKLAEYWLRSIALWRQSPDSEAAAMCDLHLQELLAIVGDDTQSGALGKAVLCAWMPFLLNADYTWSKARLMPLFTGSSDTPGVQAAWHGFVYGRHLGPEVAELMEDRFLWAIGRIDTVFADDDLRKHFLDRVAAMVVFFVDDPSEEWIPRVFAFASHPGDREHFVWSIGTYLENMDSTSQELLWERFLRRYWEDRINGVPPPSLSEEEVKIMLEWTPRFKTLFPDAVNLAIQMPGVTLDDSHLIYRIEEEKLWEKYPESTGKLLVSLGVAAGGRAGWEWHEAKEVIEGLLEYEISEDVKRDLTELVAKLGLA